MSGYVVLQCGDPAPWFHQRTSANPNFAFDSLGGRYIVLCFFGSAADPQSRAAVQAALSRPDVFDDTRTCFFGVSVDPADETENRVADRTPGFRFFWDADGRVSRLYGAAHQEFAQGRTEIQRTWFVLDPTLRIMKVTKFAPDGSDVAEIVSYLERLPPPSRFAGFEVPPPILVLPNVFEPSFCKTLIDAYETHGGKDSGFMREVDGKTVPIHDHKHKRRKDVTIEDTTLIHATQRRVMRRIFPEIQKVHQFLPTRMERYIVACYSAEDGGHFRRHRDNTTKGTAHRRFAVSINLNDDFDGGAVGFPEYGPRTFKPPAGGAVIFSCSLLLSVSRVTRGSRYAFLPFLYDDAAAQLREANSTYLAEGVGAYKASKG